MFDITCLDSYGEIITNFTQWDIDQSLKITNTGLTSAPLFHFCNKNSKEALVVKSTLVEGTITVKVPNILLQEGIPIIMYLYAYSSLTSGKTLATVRIPVRPRPKPSDYEYVENIDIVSLAVIENKINEAIQSMEDAKQGVDTKVDAIEVIIKSLQADISDIKDDIYYTNSLPTPTKLGGIEAGTVFKDKSLKSILENLLYPYIAFAITTSASTSYLEYGDTARVTSVSVSVTKGSANIVSFIITTGGVQTPNTEAVATLNALASEKSATVKTTTDYTTPTESDGVISVTVSDGTTDLTKTLKTYKHVYPYYHGVVNEGDDVGSDTLTGFGAGGRDVSAKGTKTYTYTLNNQVPVYACPASYGDVLVTDADTGTPYTFNKMEVVVTNSYKAAASYYVYKLSKPVTGTFKFKFTHS